MIKKALIILTLIIVTACGDVPPYDGPVLEKSAQMNANFKSFNQTINDTKIHGVTTGEQCNQGIIFLHGTPGDWKAWGRYMGDEQIAERAFMISVDRPGLGESTTQKSHIALKEQSKAIMTAALKQHKGPFILVGHSYGGPLEIQMAIDYPQHISSLIILAGPIDPALHKARWYHYLGNTRLAQKIIPKPLAVAAKEMGALHKDLEIQGPFLKDIKQPITMIQGGKDWLVPPANTDFAKQNLSAATLDIISIPEEGHFLPWNQYDIVKEQILKNLTTSNCTKLNADIQRK